MIITFIICVYSCVTVACYILFDYSGQWVNEDCEHELIKIMSSQNLLKREEKGVVAFLEAYLQSA